MALGAGLAPLVLGVLLGVGIGANDMATILGPVVGGNVLPWRRALVVSGVAVIVGSAIAGGQVFETVGFGLVPTPSLALQIAVLGAVVVAVLVASSTGTPVSTSQSVILAMASVAVVAGQAIDVELLAAIALAWIVFPVLSLGVAPALYRVLDGALDRVQRIDVVETWLARLIVFASGFAAFALGANHAGLALGFAAGSSQLPLFVFGALGGAAIAGGSLNSKGVVDTVGRDITQLGVISAFVALATFGVVMLSASLLGLPVSTSQAMVASVAGVGLSKGVGAVDARRVGSIVGAWLITPAVASGLAVVVFLGLTILGVV